jgi:hypothetical protein
VLLMKTGRVRNNENLARHVLLSDNYPLFLLVVNAAIASSCATK